MSLSQDNRKEIVEAIQSGKASMTELAKRYGVSIAAIGYVFRKTTGKSLQARLSPTDKEAIVAELQSGKVTIEELAPKYGVHRGTISRTFKQMTGKYLRPRRLSQKDREEIVAELKLGKQPREIAIKYGVSSSHISQVYKYATGTLLRKLTHLSQSDKATIVAEIQEKKASMRQLAKRYEVNRARISSVLKENRSLLESLYRAWHKKQKKMYVVYGIDWFNGKILITTNDFVRWFKIDHFIIMEYSGLRDRKRTPEYPEGQGICVGDIIQFPIVLQQSNGKTQETMVKDIVAYDHEGGSFIVSSLGDLLALHNDECEIIGNVYENPELISAAGE